MDAFIETFHIDWKIIIAQAVNFLVVLVILHYLVLKPLKKTMTARNTEITNGLLNAKESKELINKTREEYDQVLLDAKNEAHAIFLEAKKQSEDKKNEMLENAKSEVETLITNGKNALENEKAQIILEAKKEIVDLIIRSSNKVLAEQGFTSLNDETKEKLNNLDI